MHGQTPSFIYKDEFYLCCHESQTSPGEEVSSLLRVSDDLLSLVLQWLQLPLQLLQLPHQLLLARHLVLLDVESLVQLRHQQLHITDLPQILLTNQKSVSI